MAQLLIVGLGNLPYPLTRHSVGHVIVDSLSARLGARLSMNKTLRGYFAETKATIGEKSVEIAFFKPEALMNITGPPTAEALRKTVRSPSSLIVIHDSLEHQPASLSPKFGGSASGHNGIRSVISAVGTRDFHRLRIGIGRSTYVASYVLGRLNSHERQYWSQNGEGIDKVWEQIEKIAMQNGVAR